MTSFFPDVAFGWFFLGLLIALISCAAYTDVRKLTVPKWITLPMLALGLAVNLTRGIWLGTLGQKVWVLEPAGAVIGAVDGLMFSLAGFGVYFVTFFVLWMLGACRGGDAKLFAALGSWVGIELGFWIVVGSLVVLGLLYLFGLVVGTVTKGPRATMKAYSQAQKKVKANKAPEKIDWAVRLLNYSLPVAVSTAVVLLWVFRYDLQLVTRPPVIY